MKKLNDDKREEMLMHVKEIANGMFSGKTNLMIILFTVFVTLKMTGYITWSWWWVTAPLWGGIAIGILILIFATLLIFFAYALSES